MIVGFSHEQEMRMALLGWFLHSGNLISRCCSLKSIKSFRVLTFGELRPSV